jgi:uncharacterized protein (DUF4415 family)
MKKEYNFSKMKVKHRGPLVDPKQAKVTKTIKLDLDILGWLLREAEKRRMPYQTLINSLLKDCMDRSAIDQDEKIRMLVEETIDRKLVRVR